MVSVVGLILFLVAAAFAAAAAQEVLQCSSTSFGPTGSYEITNRVSSVKEYNIIVPGEDDSASIPLLDCGHNLTPYAVEVVACAKDKVNISINTKTHLNSNSRAIISRYPYSAPYPVKMRMRIYCPKYL